ncbi:MAG: dihydroneopterin aldolase [Acidiferrobacter sp.]
MRNSSPPDNGDIVYVHDLKVDCIIGVWEWERHTRQTIMLDLDMAVDVRAAAALDRIDATVNYKAVAKRIQAFVAASRFALVETLAEQVAALVLTEFNVPWLRLRVNKSGALSGAGAVGILIERSRTPLRPPTALG